jgi:3-hydroxy-9,10-secoandrosta-1,3,5(10)-triene-9,17-dione monooxygenase reductase component
VLGGADAVPAEPRLDSAAMDTAHDTFRLVMGRFATGISVVTTYDAGKPVGITVNALSSVSLDPPLVMIALDRRRFITPMVRAHGRYAVSILGHDQQALSDCFAHAPVSPGRDEFCGAAWHAGQTGLPVLDGAIAHLECTIVQTFSAGDHDLFIGRVDALDAPGDDGPGPDGVTPLLYFRRRYLSVEHGNGSPVEGKPEG